MSTDTPLANNGRRPGFHPVAAFNTWVTDLGELVFNWLSTLGEIGLFSLQTMHWMLTRLPRKDTILPSFYQIGVLSLPVVALTGTFIGMVLAVQSYSQFRALNLETHLGAIINI